MADAADIAFRMVAVLGGGSLAADRRRVGCCLPASQDAERRDASVSWIQRARSHMTARGSHLI